MVIKKVTVKFDSCIECPIHRYVGCSTHEALTRDDPEIPEECPIETSAMLNRYTEFSNPRNAAASLRETEPSTEFSSSRSAQVDYPLKG